MAGYIKIALLLLALSLAGCASGPSHDQNLTEQGLDAMEAGNMEEAERLLTAAVEENPNNLQALTHLATLYRTTNRPEQARELYQRVIDGEAKAEEHGQDPEEAARPAQMARDNLAQMDQEEALRQEAERAAQASVVIEPPMPAEPVPAPVVEESGYRVQTGAFAIPANAEKMRTRLEDRHAGLIQGKQVHLVTIDGLTKVRVGPYHTLKEAENACRSFKRATVNCFVIR